MAGDHGDSKSPKAKLEGKGQQPIEKKVEDVLSSLGKLPIAISPQSGPFSTQPRTHAYTGPAGSILPGPPDSIIFGYKPSPWTIPGPNVYDPAWVDFTRLAVAAETGAVSTLEKEILQLRNEVSEARKALLEEQNTAGEHKKKAVALEVKVAELQRKQRLAFLVERISPEARGFLTDELERMFLGDEPRDLFVMSIDIRRSTELMLKARTPSSFATFITSLCEDLLKIVWAHHGVLDKFTGDGILCFYPTFFSGCDAGYHALAAADACHEAFKRRYRASRRTFQSVLEAVGLGIGIDFGTCNFVQFAGGLTVVGPPVVYACRLGGAPANTTLLNQPAYDVINDRYGGSVLLNETTIDIKHEGTLIAYSAALSRTQYTPALPSWKALSEPEGKDQTSAAPATKPDRGESGPHEKKT